MKCKGLLLAGLAAGVVKALTVIGGAIIIGVGVASLCALLYVAAKGLNALRTIQERRDSQLTNEVAKMTANATPELDPVIERLEQMPEVVLVPEERTEMTDAQFIAWADSLQTWAILYRETLADPWQDTGNRLYGASGEVRALLHDWCVWESVYAAVGATKDGRSRATGFYGWVPEAEVPVREEEK